MNHTRKPGQHGKNTAAGQTPAPETEPEQASIKEQYTSHWDLDYLPREQMEELMSRNRRMPPPRNPEQARGARVRHFAPSEQATPETTRNHIGPAILLGAAALVLMVAGVFILRL